MATLKLPAELHDALIAAGYATLADVRLTDESKMKRDIGADRTNALIEWFGKHTETPVLEYAAYTLAEKE